MDRLVEPHLYRADDLHVGIKGLDDIVGRIGAVEALEHERIDLLALQHAEWVLLVAELAVERIGHLHLAVDHEVGMLRVENVHSLVYVPGAALVLAAEVGVGDHGDDGLAVEEMDCVGAEQREVDQRIGVGVTVDERVGQEERAALGVDQMHGAEVFELGIDADHLLGYLLDVLLPAGEAGNERIGVAGLHHHHAEVIAIVQFVGSLLVGGRAGQGPRCP